MNKQAAYIAQAHIILAGIAATFWLASKIPFSNPDSDSGYQQQVEQKTIEVSPKYAQGKTLFMSKCAACHSVFKDMTGPRLGGLESRGPWSDRKKLYQWIRNPEAFMKNDPYTRKLKEQFQVIMTSFPDLSDEQIDAIVGYAGSDGIAN